MWHSSSAPRTCVGECWRVCTEAWHACACIIRLQATDTGLFASATDTCITQSALGHPPAWECPAKTIACQLPTLLSLHGAPLANELLPPLYSDCSMHNIDDDQQQVHQQHAQCCCLFFNVFFVVVEAMVQCLGVARDSGTAIVLACAPCSNVVAVQYDMARTKDRLVLTGDACPDLTKPGGRPHHCTPAPYLLLVSSSCCRRCGCGCTILHVCWLLNDRLCLICGTQILHLHLYTTSEDVQAMHHASLSVW